MSPDHYLLAGLWIIYGVLHSLLAAKRLKARIAKKMGAHFIYYRVFYTLFAFVFLVAIFYFMWWMNSPYLFRPGLLVRIAGYILGGGGLLLMLICIRKYFFRLSGLRSLFEPGSNAKLIITGVHRYIRHPLYLGTFAFIWGLFLLFPQLSLLISDLIVTVYTLIGLQFEESKLLDEFGEDYQTYQKQVPALLPRMNGRKKA
jgi:protein-S-isoprenylcysteine O-methyltransferase Ste14